MKASKRAGSVLCVRNIIFTLLYALTACSAAEVVPKPIFETSGVCKKDTAVINIQRHNGKPYVPVSINGVQMEFLLDTGSERSLLTSQAVKSLGLSEKAETSVMAQINGTAPVPTRIYHLNIQIGLLNVETVKFTEVHVPKIAGSVGDGIIGAGFLRYVPFSINLSANELTIFPPQCDPIHVLGTRWEELPLVHDKALFEINVALNDSVFVGMIDTGADGIIMSMSAAKRTGLTDEALARDKNLDGEVWGTRHVGFFAHQFNLLQIGNSTSFIGPVIDVSTLKPEWFEVLVGLPILNESIFFKSPQKDSIFFSLAAPQAIRELRY